MSDLERFEILRSSEAATALASDRSQRPLNEYVISLWRIHQEEPLAQRLLQVAPRLEPYDPIRGFAEGKPHAVAFFAGGIPGVRLAQKYLTDDQIEAMAAVTPDVPLVEGDEGIDLEATQGAAQVAYIDLAQKGLSVVDRAFAQHYDVWAREAYDGALTQEMFRSGFGYVMYLAYEVEGQFKAQQLADLANLAEQSGGLDWDAGWEELGL